MLDLDAMLRLSGEFPGARLILAHAANLKGTVPFRFRAADAGRRPPLASRGMASGDIVTTLPIKEPAWTRRTRFVDRADFSRPGLIWRLVREAPDADVLVLNGVVGRFEGYADLVAAAIVARRPGAPVVLLSEVNWKRGDSVPSRLVRRLGARALRHPRIFLCALSVEDRATVTRQWGIPERQILLAPHPYTFTEEELGAPVTEDGGVFAGGNSMRDYATLLEAAAGVPARVVVATTRIEERERAVLPGNVEAGPVPHERFMALLRSASLVVVPLERRTDRSAGEQTYLNAMALGKLVIVTDVMAVREYVEHGRTGLIVPPGDADALRRTLRWALDPANAAAVARMREAARQTVRERFGPAQYAAALLRGVETARERVAGQ